MLSPCLCKHASASHWCFFLKEPPAFVHWILCLYDEQNDYKVTAGLRAYTSALTVSAFRLMVSATYCLTWHTGNIHLHWVLKQFTCWILISHLPKGLYSQSYGFSSSHIQTWELDQQEGWVPKNWCFWIVVLEKTLKIPLDSKEIKPVNPKGNQYWIFIGRTDAEA